MLASAGRAKPEGERRDGKPYPTTVTHSVLLDTKHHASPLTITRTGVIDPTQTYGATAIYGAQAGDTVINRGAFACAPVTAICHGGGACIGRWMPLGPKQVNQDWAGCLGSSDRANTDALQIDHPHA